MAGAVTGVEVGETVMNSPSHWLVFLQDGLEVRMSGRVGLDALGEPFDERQAGLVIIANGLQDCRPLLRQLGADNPHLLVHEQHKAARYQDQPSHAHDEEISQHLHIRRRAGGLVQLE